MKSKTIPPKNDALFLVAAKHGEAVHRARWPNAMPRKGMGNLAASRKKGKLSQ
jgi:hypothetical protein